MQRHVRFAGVEAVGIGRARTVSMVGRAHMGAKLPQVVGWGDHPPLDTSPHVSSHRIMWTG